MDMNFYNLHFIILYQRILCSTLKYSFIQSSSMISLYIRPSCIRSSRILANCFWVEQSPSFNTILHWSAHATKKCILKWFFFCHPFLTWWDIFSKMLIFFFFKLILIWFQTPKNINYIHGKINKGLSHLFTFENLSN